MKNTALTKDKLVDWLIENKASIESLGTDKIKQFFPLQANQINKNNFTDILIENFKKDEIYNAIFQ